MLDCLASSLFAHSPAPLVVLRQGIVSASSYSPHRNPWLGENVSQAQRSSSFFLQMLALSSRPPYPLESEESARKQRNSLGLSFPVGKEADLNKYAMLGDQWDVA